MCSIRGLYKAEKPPVRLCHAANSVISAWIGSGLGFCDSCVLWYEQVCFYKSVSAETAVSNGVFHTFQCVTLKTICPDSMIDIAR